MFLWSFCTIYKSFSCAIRQSSLQLSHPRFPSPFLFLTYYRILPAKSHIPPLVFLPQTSKICFVQHYQQNNAFFLFLPAGPPRAPHDKCQKNTPAGTGTGSKNRTCGRRPSNALPEPRRRPRDHIRCGCPCINGRVQRTAGAALSDVSLCAPPPGVCNPSRRFHTQKRTAAAAAVRFATESVLTLRC